MNQKRYVKIIQVIVVLIAVIFGLASTIKGVGILTGSDPGYKVFRPLMMYTTVMGIIYVVAGIVIWRSIARGKYVAAAICLINLLVLAVIGYMYATGDSIAADSIRAMSTRTALWLVMFLALTGISRSEQRSLINS